MDVTVIVGLIGGVASIVFAYVGYQNGVKAKSKSEGSLMSDIGYIKSGIDDLKRKQETSEQRHYDLVERVTKAEESLKSAWNVINGKGKKGEE